MMLVFSVVILAVLPSVVLTDSLPQVGADGELLPSQRQAIKTNDEIESLNQQANKCERPGCIPPGVLTKEGLENFESDCIENRESLKMKRVCAGDEVGQAVLLGNGSQPDGRRRKRSTNAGYWWTCDFPIEACCRTCRRTVPMIEEITIGKITVYPVFCPSAGGYQLIDQVACLKQGCRRECEKAFTLYSFLVTDVRPDGFQGHCDRATLPVWFTSAKVETHCICTKEGKLSVPSTQNKKNKKRKNPRKRGG